MYIGVYAGGAEMSHWFRLAASSLNHSFSAGVVAAGKKEGEKKLIFQL